MKPSLFQSVSIIFFSLFSSLTLAAEPLKIVTTLPDLAEIAKRVGGDEVKVEALLSGREDAHYVDAVPDFIRKVAGADIVCLMGLDLEVGWIPKVLAKSGNAAVQSGGKGHCDVGEKVTALEKPSGPVNRSMGDVHPGGNPHFNLSPKSLKEVAHAIAQVLKAHRPEAASAFDSRLKSFHDDMDALYTRTRERLKSAIELSKTNPVAIEYHKEFTYFFAAYDLRSLGSIEEKPGVPPSAARIATVSQLARQNGVKIAIAALYTPERQLLRFRELSGIRFRHLPTAVQARGEDNNSIEKLQETIATAIAEAVTSDNVKTHATGH